MHIIVTDENFPKYTNEISRLCVRHEKMYNKKLNLENRADQRILLIEDRETGLMGGVVLEKSQSAFNEVSQTFNKTLEYWATAVVPPKIQEDGIHMQKQNGEPVLCWDFKFYDQLNEMAFDLEERENCRVYI